MGWIMRYSNTYYSSAGAEDMVDISSGAMAAGSGGSRYAGGNGNGNKKKVIIICSIAAAVIVALGVAGFCIFKANNQEAEKDIHKEFTFAANTMVSGIDISGKTVKEAKQLLEAQKANFIAPIKFSVNVGNQSTELTQDNFEYTYDIDEVLSQVKLDEEKEVSDAKKEYNVTATVTDDSVKKNADAVGKKFNVDATNAYVSKFHPYAENRFEFVDESNGYTVDSEDLKKQLSTSFKSGGQFFSIDAVVSSKEAEVTTDFLKKNLVKLASYETYSSNGANGNTNMRISLEACNGSIIDPGKQWSFNECTGDSNQESLGYKPAGVISEGRSAIGVGGGICQSSSTIYNAAIRANMTIVERYNHKWASAYVPTGLDATIDYPGLDLTLQNDSGYQMFLECKMVDSTLYASFWGYQDPSYDVIKTRNELGESGGSSYSVRAWRVYYKDGKKVKETELPSSSYDLDNGMIFESAEGDTRADSGNVDSLEANTDSNESSESSSQSNSQSDAAPSSSSSQSSASQSSAETQQQSSSAEQTETSQGGSDTSGAGGEEAPAETPGGGDAAQP